MIGVANPALIPATVATVAGASPGGASSGMPSSFFVLPITFLCDVNYCLQVTLMSTRLLQCSPPPQPMPPLTTSEVSSASNKQMLVLSSLVPSLVSPLVSEDTVSTFTLYVLNTFSSSFYDLILSFLFIFAVC